MRKTLLLFLAAGLCSATQRDTKKQTFEAPLGRVYEAVEMVAGQNYVVINQNNHLHTITVQANGGYLIGMTTVEGDKPGESTVILHFSAGDAKRGWVPVTSTSKEIFKEVQDQLLLRR